MTHRPQRARLGYFGKIPARSDFIKAADHALTALLDQWLADVMNRLTADPRWKQKYDSMRPLHFAFVGTRSRRAIAGHIVASSDQSQRRFPFLAMSALDIDAPADFLPLSPVVLGCLWEALEAGAAGVLAADDPSTSLQALGGAVVELDPGSAEHHSAYQRFIEQHTLSTLDAMLAQGRFKGPAHRVVLALGLLLQPFRWSGSTRLETSLALPLPSARDERFAVASFWLALVSPFLQTMDVELALFITEDEGQAMLVIGFSGSSPETLQAIIDPQFGEDQRITFDDTSWIEGASGRDHKVMRLSACLEQGCLTLRSVCALFHETFA